ncbi:MAG TPA: hypothetical protein EYP88_01755, partial [Anaerolineales bacterium]|nr:hypothetical protein [Anaerolineales bacterium]
MDFLLANLVDGLLIGFIYGIAAMGLTLIFGVMDVINLAHGPIIALGMFSIYLLTTALGLHPYIALILVVVLGLLLGIVIYAIAVQRVTEQFFQDYAEIFRHIRKHLHTTHPE